MRVRFPPYPPKYRPLCRVDGLRFATPAGGGSTPPVASKKGIEMEKLADVMDEIMKETKYMNY